MVSRMDRVLRAVDRWQQRHSWLAFGVAAWKKFGDDQAGNLAALIAYYAFASIFPLLLVFVTVLDIVLSGNPELRNRLLDSALAGFPVIGDQLKHNVHALGGSGLALAVGLIFAFAGALGFAAAAQNALNSAWEVPFSRRPSFPWSLLRSIGLTLVVGIGQIVTVTLSGIAGGTGHVISGAASHIAAVAVALVLNIAVFWVGFRLATAREIPARDLRLGALIAGTAWQVLQLVGGYLFAHQLARSSSLYGTFGIVLGLLAWLFLEAQLTLYAVEINVTAVRRLWPRSLFPPPLTEQDLAAYRLYAQVEQRRQGQEIDVEETGLPDGDPPGR
ncbi:MAG TPA: YihY/virulence factor BrkB family protein [Streptosporangiaceae bacterium]|nr:YihY/virulence factor BrkB family protein [Streptosporangiaceae bacterium]